MRRFGLGVLALTAAVTMACNGNGNTSNDEKSTVGTAGAPVAHTDDRTFIEHMLDASQAEIDLGKLASQRASNAEVKRFASMMVADHSKSGAALDAIATRQGIPALAQREEKHREIKDRLSKLNGAEFDREYMAAMVDGHEDVYDMLRSRVDVGNFGDNKGVVTPEKEHDPVDGDVNQWAAGSIAVVKHHLDEAKQINDQLKSRNTTN
jgi:putative membrane protein